MNLRYFFVVFLLYLAGFSLIGCTTTSPLRQKNPPGEISNWQSNIPHSSNQISIKGQLHPNSSVHIILAKEKPEPRYNPYLLKITLSDENCTGGHEVKLEFKEDRNLLQTLYFKQPIPWDTEFELKIVRDLQNNVQVRINQEEEQFHMQQTAEYLNINTQQKPLFIRTIDITEASH